MEFKLPRCQNCGKTATARDMIRIVTSKATGNYVDVCKKCFPIVQGKLLKNAELKQEAKDTAYWKDGAREVDFKSYIEKWAKKISKT